MALWMDLEVTDFYHIGGNDFGISLLAFATRDRRPLQNERIQFFAGGHPLNDAVKTEKGRALKENEPLQLEKGLKKILVEAHILETEKRQKKIIDVPWPVKEKKEEQKAPTELLVTFSGKHGRQNLTISVSSADGLPIIGFIGTIIDGGDKKSFTIENDGTASYQTKFTEKSRVFEVRAGNTENLIWIARLLGPKKEANHEWCKK